MMSRDPRLTLSRELDRNISGTIIEEPAFSGYFDLTSPVGPPAKITGRDNQREDVIKVLIAVSCQRSAVRDTPAGSFF